MPTIEQRYFETSLAEGRPYFGPYMHAFQGNPIRHGYMRLLVELLSNSINTRPIKVLEVGSWAGGSAVTWACALKEHSNGYGHQVVCIDSWQPYFDPDFCAEDNNPIYQSMHQALLSGEIFRLFLHNIRTTNNQDLVIPIVGRSSSVLPLLSPGTFDIVYIDGAHDYESVSDDLRNSVGLLAEDGVLCGDDLEAQLDQVDASFCKSNRHLDFVCDPATGISYHPGVTLAVSEVVPRVSNWNGFWALQKRGSLFANFDDELFTNQDVTIPAHIHVDSISPPALEIHNHNGFNIIKYLGQYWAIAQCLGPMDLTTIDVSIIDAFVANGYIKVGDSLESAIRAVNAQPTASKGR